MRSIACATIICLTFFLTTTLNCQVESLAFDHLTQDHGLLTNSYNSFVKLDSRDLIWIGSIEGVARYDGFQFDTYPIGPPDGIFDKYVQSTFFEDARGDLWFATYQALNCYRRNKNTFDTYQLCDSSGSLIDANYHVFHLENLTEKLWLKAGDRVFSLDITQPEWNYQALPFSVNSVRFTVDTTADGIAKRIYGCGWDSARGIELIAQDGPNQSWTYARYLVKGAPAIALKPITVIGAIIQNDYICWLFSDQGLIRFDRRRPNYPNLLFPSSEKGIQFSAGVWLDEYRLLLSSKKKGLWILNTETGNFSKIVNQNKFGLIDNSPKELYLDRQKRLWISYIDQGLNVSRFPKAPFKNPLARLAPELPSVKHLLEDRSGNIWVATETHGVYIISPQLEILRHLPFESTAGGPLELKRINHLSQDSSGRIWCAGGHMIGTYNEKQRKWVTVIHDENRQFWRIHHLSNNRNLVITDQGLMDLQSTNQGYQLEKSEDFIPLRELEIPFLHERKNGNLLFSYMGNDLISGESFNKKFRFIDTIKVGAIIFGFLEDTINHGLWLGTSKGLVFVNHQGIVQDTLQANWELGSSTAVYQLQPDHSGSLWISSNRGLWRYAPKDQELVHFSKEDGLPSNEFSFYASLRTRQNQLWFGGSQGLVVFDPDSIQPYPYRPNVLINQLFVNDSLYKGPKYIGETDTLRLKYYQNSLDFELLAPTYHLASLNKLRYRLSPWDNNWKMVNNGDYVSFPRLPSGKYTLEIQAFNSNNLGGPLKTLSIIITPPFWQRWWFRLLVVSILAWGIYALVQEYVQRQLREQQRLLERQAAIQAERTRIADELHDDMGEGLTAILYAIDDFSDSEQGGKLQTLQRIASRAKELLEKKEEIIWALDDEKNSLHDLAVRLRRHTSAYLAENNLQPDLNFPDQAPNLTFGGEWRRHIFLIVKELLHNVVKHAQASTVTFILEIEEEARLKIVVRDNGIGMDASKNRPDGRGMHSLKRRVEAIQGNLIFRSGAGEGTEALLTVPLPKEKVYRTPFGVRFSTRFAGWKKWIYRNLKSDNL